MRMSPCTRFAEFRLGKSDSLWSVSSTYSYLLSSSSSSPESKHDICVGQQERRNLKIIRSPTGGRSPVDVLEMSYKTCSRYGFTVILRKGYRVIGLVICTFKTHLFHSPPPNFSPQRLDAAVKPKEYTRLGVLNKFFPRTTLYAYFMILLV